MAAAVLQNGVYFIQNLGTGTVIDLDKGSSVNGTNAIGYTKRELGSHWVPAQLWVINQVGNGNIYTIQNANSRTYLDLRNQSNGASIQGYTGSGSDFQKWVITRNNAGTAYVIANKETGTYIDLDQGKPGNFTKIQGWNGAGANTSNSHQLWLIVRA